MKVRKRNGKIVEYDGKKIISAINKAFKAAEVEDKLIPYQKQRKAVLSSPQQKVR